MTTETPSALTKAARRVHTATEERDRIIREMHAEGHSLRAIGEWAGLSHTAIKNIVDRAT